MEGFWKWLAKTANNQLSKRELKKAPAGIMNQLHSLSGELSTHIEVLGTGLVQRFSEITSKQLSDMLSIIKEGVTDAVDKKLSGTNAHMDQYARVITGQVCGIEGELLRLVNKSEKRQNVLMQSFEELARQAAIHDQHNTDRTLSLLSKIDLLQGMQVGLFENLGQQVQAMRTPRDKQRFDTAPTLEWLLDNVDGVMELGSTLQLARSNDIPRSAAKMEIIRRIRALNFYSVLDVRDETERLLEAWDNDQQLRAA